MQAFRTRTTYGLCFGIKPNSSKATLLLNILEPVLHRCHICGSEAVRVGMYPIVDSNEKGTEFRALCTRHEGFGMWGDHNTAWGFD